MTHKHTTGPWNAHESGLISAGPQCLHIAQTVTTGMGHAAAANARLLAAAPDMLQALQMALVSIERNAMQQGQDPSTDTEAAIVRAAITKALEG
jgi:hypothetical protein